MNQQLMMNTNIQIVFFNGFYYAIPIEQPVLYQQPLPLLYFVPNFQNPLLSETLRNVNHETVFDQPTTSNHNIEEVDLVSESEDETEEMSSNFEEIMEDENVMQQGFGKRKKSYSDTPNKLHAGNSGEQDGDAGEKSKNYEQDGEVSSELINDGALPVNGSSSNTQPKISWHVTRVYDKFCNHFKKQSKVLEIRMEHNLSNVNLFDVDAIVESFFQKLVEDNTRDAAATDRITVSFNHEGLDRSIFVNFRKNAYRDKTIFEAFNKAVQSNMSVLLDGSMKVNISIIKNISGSAIGRRSAAPRTPTVRTERSKSVVQIRNNDNSCGYMAIALGKFLADIDRRKKEHNDKFKTLCHQNNQKLHRLTHALCAKAGVDRSQPMDLSEILPKIQDSLVDYQIIVVDGISKTQLFVGPYSEKSIILQYLENHFDLITKIAGYMRAERFCVPCWKKSSRRRPHVCPSGCKMCLNRQQCEGEPSVLCEDCSRLFFTTECFQRHLTLKLCHLVRRCTMCNIQYSSANHVCDRYHCNKCNSYYTSSPHYCMMQKLDMEKLKREDEKLKYIVAFDIESTQACIPNERENQNSTYLIHHPILLVASISCNVCEDEYSCHICGNEKKDFYGNSCVSRFNDYLLNDLAVKAERQKGRVFVFAHNNKGYDGHFVVRDLFTRHIGDEQIVMQGSKILKLDIGNVRYIDTLSFFHQGLDKLPKSFGIENITKGYFPHVFNTRENQDYVGPIPPMEMYSPHHMKPAERIKFEAWYNQQAGREFNWKTEMIEYCKKDVSILLQSIMKFRQLFKNVTGLDPITRCFTLASVGLEYFRACILTENTMAITPTTPYGKIRMSSRSANIWLDWLEKTEGIIDREQRVGPYYCDGKQGNKIFEFWGCRWHGCDECFSDRNTMIPVGDSQKSREQLRAKVREKEQYYTSRNFQLIQIWEHDYKQIRKESRFKVFEKERHSFYEKHGDSECLDIRDFFFGGRTNNLVFARNCDLDEEIVKQDFTSLYPSVLCKYTYPVGHPIVVRENFKPIDQYFGFVKCKVHPPCNLYIPVLPARIDDKLMFTLCNICGNRKSGASCEHSFDDRCIEGTWTTAELSEAVKCGYEITEIKEIVHYDENARSNTLYRDYIKTWLKIKTESSGWPSWCDSEAQKQRYIQDFLEKEGIILEYDRIAINEGLRFIAKLMLNTLWGKFAQRCNLRKTMIIRDRASYWKLLEDDTIDITGEYSPLENIIIMDYEKRFIEDCEPGQTNIAVASFVTSYARLELYDFIKKIERIRPRSTLYFDTDACTYVRKLSDEKIPTGDYLGELTDEIEKEFGVGSRCTKFSSCGPKNYAIQVKLADGSTKTSLKIKGLTLNCETLDLINFEEMVRIAEEYTAGNSESISVPQWNIMSNKQDHIVKTKYFRKIYRACSEKRRINGLGTLPYGYIDAVE